MSSTQKETESILLLHGAMTGGPEWDLVVTHLSKQYHLLVPDIPLHNASSNVKLNEPGIDTGIFCKILLKAPQRMDRRM